MPAAFSLPLMLALAVGYLLGSIPFGLLLTRAAGLGDIRAIGSGNIGATNVLRTGNKVLAVATLVLDALKGTAAVLLGAAIPMTFAIGEIQALATANHTSVGVVAPASILVYSMAGGFGAFVGHLYPVWLGFKGGKGVATYIGVVLGLFWPAAVAFCAVWLLAAAVTRYSSLSALLASVAAPLVVWALGVPQVAVLLVPLSALLIHKHRANIERLLNGEEPRIGQSKIGQSKLGAKA